MEYFTNLERLNCSGNRITDIDLSHAAGLQYLNCSDNAIAEISLSENHSIATLLCFGNPISKLDIDGCKNLVRLCLYDKRNDCVSRDSISICKYSQSQTFELSACNTPFVKFSFTDAPEVTALSFSGDFTDVDISRNKTMQDVDVQNLTKLVNLNVSECSLKSIDVTGNTKLKVFNCCNNDIGQIDVKNNTLLEELNVSENKSLTSVDISSLSNLSVLDVSNCSLKSIDVTKNTGLSSFKCPCNDLSSVNVRRNSSLRVFDVSDNKNISAIDVWDNLELRELYASGLCFSELDLTENKQLKILDVSNNSKLAEVVFSSPESLYGVFAKNDASIKFMDSDGQTLYWGSEINIDGKIWSGYNAGATVDNGYGETYSYDPAQKACPDGWRTPTKYELASLSANYSSETTVNGMKGRWLSGSETYSSSVPAIFLPYLKGISLGYYWSSSIYDDSYGYYLRFNSTEVKVYKFNRSTLYAVRCIKDI